MKSYISEDRALCMEDFCLHICALLKTYSRVSRNEKCFEQTLQGKMKHTFYVELAFSICFRFCTEVNERVKILCYAYISANLLSALLFR
jgi:hypothetical protein